MKKISELGLEAIELEDQVLLVNSKIDIEVGDWYTWDGNKNKAPSLCCDFYQSSSILDSRGFSKFYKVIASTKPLEGIPLLVIEDEVDNLGEDHTNIRILQHNTSILNARQYFDGFKDGYNKAKTHKFTEVDLRNAIQYGKNIGYYYASQKTYLDPQDLKELEEELEEDVETYIQSLTKKELWVEVEEYDHAQNITDRHKFRPNVSEGKIKAVWK